MYITAEYISTTLFSPYGSIISPDEEVERLATKRGYVENNANQGTAIKISSVSTIQNISTSHVPNINIFRCFVKETIPKTEGFSVVVPVLEKHPNTSQTFIPIGSCRNDVSHVVVVALPDPHNNDEPDLCTLRAFLCKGNQGVTYGVGVWHAPMITLAMTSDTKFVDFAVVIYEVQDKDHPELNCIERYYRDPPQIVINKVGEDY
ncbi:similar to Saccharomyces cerevisiae YIR032C DAL3 Ureidoglycolate hydrolase, converts ureidoglycolate to glyoxylate and urea in the third step of allantoin degradation [Maudiozyma saulgeensis]|uniref:Similar to Saccharomyces cerevisiae YIR032C DAL3 Ureidoglycolate hydrolase, converts ureidoglycolate to glyoxylate and urea in the third step of allantoin degradation n=1 Tax=Maudiozyma saulgeensis TaxID=1789683 RepID=A0A1X7RAS4_9SACH|nr:similar to Saccharomyces cerevisiae YIR032C DAL3 Ureidoglycolate hydrolase, converts ureidoglycolate to glyoxylate and urea in the third step of allantoin degradation [Kazachstania saulgeensis]